jgi:hypothetical protein
MKKGALMMAVNIPKGISMDVADLQILSTKRRKVAPNEMLAGKSLL